jgi:hypothetical protein
MCKGMDGDVRMWEGSNLRRCECVQLVGGGACGCLNTNYK